jgi:hypothetical protein
MFGMPRNKLNIFPVTTLNTRKYVIPVAYTITSSSRHFKFEIPNMLPIRYWFLRYLTTSNCIRQHRFLQRSTEVTNAMFEMQWVKCAKFLIYNPITVIQPLDPRETNRTSPVTFTAIYPLKNTGVLISPLPDLLHDVFCFMVIIFRLMLVVFYIYIYILYIYTVYIVLIFLQLWL